MNYLIFFFYVLLTSPAQVEHIAKYEYTLEDHELELKFSIKKDELIEFELNKHCDIKKMTDLCTTKYLNNNSKIEISGESVTFELSRSYTKNGEFIMILKTDLNSTKTNSIIVYNNCFYEFESTFKNRVIVNIRDVQKLYDMNNNRKTISFQL